MRIVDLRAVTLAFVVASLVAGSAQTSLRFEDHPSQHTFTGTPAPPQLNTSPYGNTFRTRLRNGAKQGPNFAGAFTVVIWGCGSPCQMVAVIDARTGQLSKQHLHTTTGVSFRPDSRLIVADPIGPKPNAEDCAVCSSTAGYEWTGTEFKPVGPGPHPHVAVWE